MSRVDPRWGEDIMSLDVWMRELNRETLLTSPYKSFGGLPDYLQVLFCYELPSGFVAVGATNNPFKHSKAYVLSPPSSMTECEGITSAFFTLPHTNAVENKKLLFAFFRHKKIRGAVFNASFSEVCAKIKEFTFHDHREEKEKKAQAFLKAMQKLVTQGIQ